MSKLTQNLLHGIDYEGVKHIREKNYTYLKKSLNRINQLTLSDRIGSFMYPLLLENGSSVREKLQKRKIYIPLLWPDVFEFCSENETAYMMAKNILPLPIDQRYGTDDMKYIVEEIAQCMRF